MFPRITFIVPLVAVLAAFVTAEGEHCHGKCMHQGETCVYPPFSRKGTCRTQCGGFKGGQCPNPGYECLDDPSDKCDPQAGGADCIGYCSPIRCTSCSNTCPEGTKCDTGVCVGRDCEVNEELGTVSGGCAGTCKVPCNKDQCPQIRYALAPACQRGTLEPRPGGGAFGTRPWWLALLACGGRCLLASRP